MPLKESQTTELKKSLSQLDDKLKSICAFLNHHGGIIENLAELWRNYNVYKARQFMAISENG